MDGIGRCFAISFNEETTTLDVRRSTERASVARRSPPGGLRRPRRAEWKKETRWPEGVHVPGRWGFRPGEYLWYHPESQERWGEEEVGEVNMNSFSLPDS